MRQTLLVLALCSCLGAASAVSAANLRVTTIAPSRSDADHPVTWSFTVQNVSGEHLPAAPLTLQFSPGRIVSALPSQLSCVDLNGYFSCTLPALAPRQSFDLGVTVQHPFVHGRVASHLSVAYIPGLWETAARSTAFWREYPVTTAADSGPGSLRQTILDINAACSYQGPYHVPCKAAFRITDPVPAAGWYTVEPLTPLPAVTAYDAAIDGSTQGKTNPHGPSVALDGSALFSGDGLTGDGIGTSNTFEVSGLAIGGFPGNGVHGGNETFLNVHDCYIGVDPTGRQATPNGSRGIAANLMIGLIENNVIGGNVRSGVYFMGSRATGPTIRGNRIGVAAHDDTPIGNGASGIFVADFRGHYTYPAIEGNVIANNAIGIALTANAPMIILGNTIRDNAQSGIDIGLDGPTESAPGVPGVHGGIIPPPVIQSATYEDGITTIRGYSLAGDSRQVLLYANTTLEPGGYAEGEQYLGITPLQYHTDTTFTFQYAGDLRGKYINGSSYGATWWNYDEFSYTSSEFGRARAVEGDPRKRRRAVR